MYIFFITLSSSIYSFQHVARYQNSWAEHYWNRTFRHHHLSVRTCEQWWHGWMDRDSVWGGEWGRARYGCIRFWWWSSKGKGQFGGEYNAEMAYRLVCEKLTIFPYAECTVEFCEGVAFLRYSQVQDRIRVEEKFKCKNATKQTQHTV